MGNSISSLFGGGAEIPDYTPAPEREETEGAETRDAERKKLRARAGGVRSTLLNQKLGTGGSGSSGLLGRSVDQW